MLLLYAIVIRVVKGLPSILFIVWASVGLMTGVHTIFVRLVHRGTHCCVPYPPCSLDGRVSGGLSAGNTLGPVGVHWLYSPQNRF